jgi:ankyrin repeat protein
LHVVAESSVWKSEEIVRALLKAGADIEAADKFGHRPLHLAVRHWLQEEQPFVLLEQLENGADVHAKDKAGHTAPDIAVNARQMPEGKEKMRQMFNRYAVKQAARAKAAQDHVAEERAKLRAKGKKPGLKLKK